MARAFDAGSDDALTCITSELGGKETDPQPDRVGFKQVISRKIEKKNTKKNQTNKIYGSYLSK